MLLSEAKEILKKNGYELLTENEMSEYLLTCVKAVAQDIFEREIMDNAPSLDNNNMPSREYLSRFDYLSDSLKNAVKRGATRLKNEFDAQGIKINQFNIETEIYDALKCFSKN